MGEVFNTFLQRQGKTEEQFLNSWMLTRNQNKPTGTSQLLQANPTAMPGQTPGAIQMPSLPPGEEEVSIFRNAFTFSPIKSLLNLAGGTVSAITGKDQEVPEAPPADGINGFKGLDKPMSLREKIGLGLKTGIKSVTDPFGTAKELGETALQLPQIMGNIAEETAKGYNELTAALDRYVTFMGRPIMRAFGKEDEWVKNTTEVSRQLRESTQKYLVEGQAVPLTDKVSIPLPSAKTIGELSGYMMLPVGLIPKIIVRGGFGIMGANFIGNVAVNVAEKFGAIGKDSARRFREYDVTKAVDDKGKAMLETIDMALAGDMILPIFSGIGRTFKFVSKTGERLQARATSREGFVDDIFEGYYTGEGKKASELLSKEEQSKWVGFNSDLLMRERAQALKMGELLNTGEFSRSVTQATPEIADYSFRLAQLKSAQGESGWAYKKLKKVAESLGYYDKQVIDDIYTYGHDVDELRGIMRSNVNKRLNSSKPATDAGLPGGKMTLEEYATELREFLKNPTKFNEIYTTEAKLQAALERAASRAKFVDDLVANNEFARDFPEIINPELIARIKSGDIGYYEHLPADAQMVGMLYGVEGSLLKETGDFMRSKGETNSAILGWFGKFFRQKKNDALFGDIREKFNREVIALNTAGKAGGDITKAADDAREFSNAIWEALTNRIRDKAMASGSIQVGSLQIVNWRASSIRDLLTKADYSAAVHSVLTQFKDRAPSIVKRWASLDASGAARELTKEGNRELQAMVRRAFVQPFSEQGLRKVVDLFRQTKIGNAFMSVTGRLRFGASPIFNMNNFIEGATINAIEGVPAFRAVSYEAKDRFLDLFVRSGERQFEDLGGLAVHDLASRARLFANKLPQYFEDALERSLSFDDKVILTQAYGSLRGAAEDLALKVDDGALAILKDIPVTKSVVAEAKRSAEQRVLKEIKELFEYGEGRSGFMKSLDLLTWPLSWKIRTSRYVWEYVGKKGAGGLAVKREFEKQLIEFKELNADFLDDHQILLDLLERTFNVFGIGGGSSKGERGDPAAEKVQHFVPVEEIWLTWFVRRIVKGFTGEGMIYKKDDMEDMGALFAIAKQNKQALSDWTFKKGSDVGFDINSMMNRNVPLANVFRDLLVYFGYTLPYVIEKDSVKRIKQESSIPNVPGEKPRFGRPEQKSPSLTTSQT